MCSSSAVRSICGERLAEATPVLAGGRGDRSRCRHQLVAAAGRGGGVSDDRQHGSVLDQGELLVDLTRVGIAGHLLQEGRVVEDEVAEGPQRRRGVVEDLAR